MKKWSEADTIRFVKLYCEQSCLWDTTIPTYKNFYMRNEALQHLVTAMNMEDFTIADARLKVKSLRNTYNQERRKIERAVKYDENYTPVLKWFQIMDSALRKKNVARTSAVNNQIIYSIESGQDSDSEKEIFTFGTEDDLYEQDGIIEKNPLEISTTTTAPALPTEDGTTSWSSPPERKRSRQDFEPLPEQYRSRQPTVKEGDEFDAFGKYMAEGLKNMPIHLALQCQNELQATMIQFRLLSLGAPPRGSSAGESEVSSLDSRAEFRNKGAAATSSIDYIDANIKAEYLDENCPVSS